MRLSKRTWAEMSGNPLILLYLLVQQGKTCPIRQGRRTFVPEPKGSEPSPRKVCQNATLKRSLSQELDVSAACTAQYASLLKRLSQCI